MSGKATKYGMPQLILIDKIIDSRFQVRLDDGDIDTLAVSIEKHGLQQPILLRPIGELFEIVFGTRRVRAAKKAGQTFIQAVVKELSDEDALDIHGLENLERRNYCPIEEALYYKQCIELGKSLTQIAKDRKKSVASLRLYLYLLDLPKDIQDRIHNRKISLSKALGLAILTRKKRTPKEKSITDHQGFIKAPRITKHYDDIRAIADDEELRDSIAVEMAAKLVRDGVPRPEAIDMAKKDYAVRMFKDRSRPLTPAEAAKALEEALPDKEKLEESAKKMYRSQVIQLFQEYWKDGILDCPVCGKCGITWECSGKPIWENLRSDEDV